MWYTKFDIHWGYNNVLIKKGDEHKTAFKTKRGLYQYRILPFGLHNAPATFQAMMNATFYPIIIKHEQRGTIIRVYMDDIGVATTTSEADHTAAITDILQLAEDNDLYFKLSKCTFHSP